MTSLVGDVPQPLPVLEYLMLTVAPLAGLRVEIVLRDGENFMKIYMVLTDCLILGKKLTSYLNLCNAGHVRAQLDCNYLTFNCDRGVE